MEDNKEKKEPTSCGNEWEVVSLTESTYTAAPGPKQVEVNDEDGSVVEKDEAETSSAVFMSGHFVFPPSQHENFSLEPENVEIQKGQVVQVVVLETTADGGISNSKAEQNWKVEELTISNEFPGIQFSDDKGSSLSISGTDFEQCMALQGLNLMDKEQSLYETGTFNSLHSEATIDESTTIEENRGISGPNEQSDQGLGLDLSDMPKGKVDDNYNGLELPCEAWWKRRAFSLYCNAKEANRFWSIFIAAAVMGLVILGHRWQQERWKVLQIKREIGINDARMGRMLGPISRLKDAIVSGSQRGSSISTSMKN